MHVTWVQSLGQEDSLEKEMALQYSCLENAMDRRVWQATVHGVSKESNTTEAAKQQQRRLIQTAAAF